MRSVGLRRCALPVAAALLMLAGAAHGHGVHLQRRRIHVRVAGGRAVVEYRAQVARLLLILLGVGAKPLEELTDGDRESIAQQVDGMVYPCLTLRLDNVVMPLATRARSCRPVAGGVEVCVVYAAEIRDRPAGRTTVSLLDSTEPVEEGDVPQFQVAGGDGIGEVRREEGGRAVTFSFDRAAVARQDPASGAVDADSSTRPIEPDREMSAMTAFLRKADLTAGTVLLALGVALALGAAHALSPGHGKAMVAAYLVGSRGRVRDAILLGGVVTFTHVISVLIIGLIALVLSKFVVPQKLFPWISAASGVLIVIVGFWLLVRTAGGAGHAHHEHAHSHAESHDGHSHSHTHVHRGDVTLGGMISLGVAGGMVPCPTALVVLLVAVTLNRIVLGLVMILAFSAGLASVLILIGVLTVTASRFLRRFSDDRGWVRKLPIASSAVIMIVGLMIILRALVAAGIVSVNL